MRTNKEAPQKALNLQAVNHYLTKETSAAYVADDLDEIIFDFIYAIGEAENSFALPLKTVATHIYHLVNLRNMFLFTAISNGESLNTHRIKSYFEDENETEP